MILFLRLIGNPWTPTKKSHSMSEKGMCGGGVGWYVHLSAFFDDLMMGDDEDLGLMIDDG